VTAARAHGHPESVRIVQKTLAATLLAALLLGGAAACGSAQASPLQQCESAIKTAIDNGAQLTTGAQPAAVKTACGSLSSAAKLKADAYAETYYAQKHEAAPAGSVQTSAPSSPSPAPSVSAPATPVPSTPVAAATASPQASAADCAQASSQWYAASTGGQIEIEQLHNVWANIGAATVLSTQYAEGQALYLDTTTDGSTGAAPPACNSAALSAWTTAMHDLGQAGWLEYHSHTSLTLVPQAVTDANAGFSALSAVATDAGQA
jgi:hypothetical protein